MSSSRFSTATPPGCRPFGDCRGRLLDVDLGAGRTDPLHPLTLCLVVMGRHVKSLEFFDVLLGDRPALSEVDRFYQRTLANDPDEALDQAEKMLADRPLVDYYDSVVLPGLKLAAARRGTRHDQPRSAPPR